MYAFDETMFDEPMLPDFDVNFNTTMDYDMLYNSTMEDYKEMLPDYDYAAYSEMMPEKEDFNSADDVITWTQEQMRADFRDEFEYAMDAMDFDYSMPSRCNDSCNDDYDKCCTEVSMMDS